MTELAVFGGGCFWCTEAIFQQLRGVISVTPGYTGGSTKNPTYEDVCGGRTGHVESAKIEFDPDILPYKDLVLVFMNTHDPTTLNRQGYDVGTEYASAIFYRTPEQKAIAEKTLIELQQTPEFQDKKIVTQVRPLETFYEAEEEHKDFYLKHPEMGYCQVIISPKLQRLRTLYSQRLKA